MRRTGIAGVCVLAACVGVLADMTTAPTTRSAIAPATRPTQQQALDAEKTLDRMLAAKPGTARPLEPVSPTEANATYRPKANDIAPVTPAVPLRSEGDVITQRVGRLQRAAESKRWEFRFDSDRTTLEDPPLALLPNQRLAQMEETVARSGRDVRFKVTGMVTAYKGENYLLVEKVELVPDQEGL